MKIENVGRIQNISDKQNLENKETNIKKQSKNIPASMYQKSKLEDKGHVYDENTINELKLASEKSYSHLKKMIEDIISRQGKAINLLDPKSVITIDQATRNEANKLIDTNGQLGIESVSDNIVDFAKALSGGDKTKLDTLKNAIDKGFKAAEKVLGTLPEISQKTYDRIMEKLDNWED